MNILQWFIRHITYPLFLYYDGNGRAVKYLNYFNYIEKMDRDALLASQKDRLQSILQHAYENTEYYRALFDDNDLDVDTEDFVERFEKLPLLTKKIVKDNYDALTAKNVPASEITKASTGGSTGVPMYFLRDKECLYMRRGQELFFDRWMGYEIGKKLGYFVAGSHFDGRMSELKFKIRNALTNRMVSFDPHDITEGYMESFLAEFNSHRPEMIKCFPNALAPFVHFVKKNNHEIAPVKVISCTGETLYKQQKEQFEEVFKGKVFEKVGTRESGVFACECREHEGLHIFTEGVYLELIKQDGSLAGEGEMGKVVITDLFNKVMPLIRYEIGDMAISAGDKICQCGSALPMLKSYLGRTRDILVDSEHNPRPGYLFVEIIKNLNLNAQIQVYQPEKNRVLIRVVKKSEEPIDTSDLVTQCQEILGDRISVEIEYVDEIQRDPSGKYSYVKSDINFMDLGVKS
jgi:phenylacetate-coenzyme A ligase PaaK-like adenylate-forming protein